MRCGMTLMGEDANNYLIGITPRYEKDREVFSRAFLQLSKATFLPDRMLLVDTNGKDTQDYKFKTVESNQPINPQFFQALAVKGWKVVVNPEPAQAAQASRPASPPAGPRSARGRAGRLGPPGEGDRADSEAFEGVSRRPALRARDTPSRLLPP